jgi:D-inositol-3-phosphate glycosyltransferase
VTNDWELFHASLRRPSAKAEALQEHVRFTEIRNGPGVPNDLLSGRAEHNLARSCGTEEVAVTLLTGGGDRPYAFGLARALMSEGIALDLIGSDELDCPEFQSAPKMNFLNLRGNQQADASFPKKVVRVATYYVKLLRYALTAKPKIFHILWNNKLEYFDRTLLMLYYRLLRKRIVLTVHNVNAARRDSSDSLLNRLTLRIQYRLADYIFVHTENMRSEIIEDYGVHATRVTVIPFGINNAVPNTSLTSWEARQRLGIPDGKRTILFFGNIAPYKGLEYLIAAYQHSLTRQENYHLIVAGRPKNCESYWTAIRDGIRKLVERGQILLSEGFIPDDETEIYFKAADVLVLPYRHVYESGVLFLGFSFGLPVLAADVGSLRDEIEEGKTGFVFKPEDPADLAKAIERYFASELWANLDDRRQKIRESAAARHSWNVVSHLTMSVYSGLLRAPGLVQLPNQEARSASFDIKAPS